MLRALTKAEAEKHLDFAYALALDQERSAYPTYADGIKTHEDFVSRTMQAFERPHEELLLFEADGCAEGWVHYCALPADRCVMFHAFGARRLAAQAIDETIAYLAQKYPGCMLEFGMPAQNGEMIAHLEALSFETLEDSLVNTLRFSDYACREEESGITRITRANFAEFAALHAVHDEDMYWNNARIEPEVEKWDIYLLSRGGEPVGAICAYCIDGSMEIFSVDYRENRFDETIFAALLTKLLNEGKRSGVKNMTFFCERAEQETVAACGFSYVGGYRLYAKRLPQ